jgi:hypothetical protein
MVRAEVADRMTAPPGSRVLAVQMARRGIIRRGRGDLRV